MVKEMTFAKESDFENALIKILFSNGWECDVLKNPSEQDLINNWASILFANNCDKDRLNNCPLTEGEMAQIIEQINTLRTPLKLNSFINGKTVSIKRDNSVDTAHFGKEVSLKIYDRQEIAAGQSRYQIAQQPKFPTRGILNDRRGDLMLLINGMPVIHIELKKSGIPVSQAVNQIKKYSTEGVFSGLFSLVQIFVAMEPNETVYFANLGKDINFNPDFYFHWANFDNERITNWKDIASTLLSIPMAHQLIGFYTIPDDTDGILKVMRSYQYYAANAISDRVAKTRWGENNLLGGYIWHTTGSGKTMTSFKSAQLIANSKNADKVIFLIDRIELGTQSLKEYQGFAEDSDDIQATENTQVLISKLISCDPANTLIVTSIQKMSRIKEENGMKAADIEKMSRKRIVFIVDEAHRSVFGDMLITIKSTFPNAIFFGFTGTPIYDENQIRANTTATVFGDELHRYSIADGIKDKNVLGFDPYQVLTYRDKDLRTVIALHQAKADSETEAINDPSKSQIYYHFMNDIPMAGSTDDIGHYIKGIEDYLPTSQYTTNAHKEKVVQDILDNWMTLSHDGKFHAIFATSSIVEAIAYYQLIKKKNPALKVTALFDSNITNDGNESLADEEEENPEDESGEALASKEAGLVKIITDYNNQYGQTFNMGTHAKFKKDIAARLAHKEPYRLIERTPEQQIDILIVVNQMLTGFDSKWINTLYLDKVLENQNIIQAFSRTNRLFGHEKPFGTIRYYRKPHTMRRNVKEAVKLYAGDKPIDLFVQKLKENLDAMNKLFGDIKMVFERAGVADFKQNPADKASRGKFASLFGKLNNHLEAAKIQGFKWNQPKYSFDDATNIKESIVKMEFDENIYLTLALRYKELFLDVDDNNHDDVPFDVDGYLTEIDTEKINADYMNSQFTKYLKLVENPQSSPEAVAQTLNDLHKTFATLTQEEQKYAGLFLHDIESAEIDIDERKTFRDYITEYQSKAKNDQIHRVANVLGLDESMLREMMGRKLTEKNINEYGRFSDLKKTIDDDKARAFIVEQKGSTVSPLKVRTQTADYLRNFLLGKSFPAE
jgi:type I restriction enzyme R subunit